MYLADPDYVAWAQYVPLDEFGKPIFVPHLPSSLIFPGRSEQPPPKFNKAKFGKMRYSKPYPQIRSSFAEKALEVTKFKDAVDLVHSNFAFKKNNLETFRPILDP